MARQVPEESRSRIRAAVAALTAGAQRRYPVQLQAQIAEYARERMEAGAARAQVVKEIGVSDPTLSRLLGAKGRRRRPQRSVFRPVIVDPGAERAAGAAIHATSLVVRGPGGIVIEGLDVAGVAALIRALS